MAIAKQESPKPVEMVDHLFDRLPELFGRWPELSAPWPELFRRPVLFWPGVAEDMLRVDEFKEDGSLVIRAEMAGIDPEKDVEITVTDSTLHIAAERQVEEKTKGRDYERRELRYGSFRRDLPLPRGCTEKDVRASYKDGILEIRVPLPEKGTKEATVKKIPVKRFETRTA